MLVVDADLLAHARAKVATQSAVHLGTVRGSTPFHGAASWFDGVEPLPRWWYLVLDAGQVFLLGGAALVVDGALAFPAGDDDGGNQVDGDVLHWLIPPLPLFVDLPQGLRALDRAGNSQAFQTRAGK